MFGHFKKKEPAAPEPPTCTCGAQYVSDHWPFPSNGEMSELYGYTCPTLGCGGNLKEQHQKFIDACRIGYVKKEDAT